MLCRSHDQIPFRIFMKCFRFAVNKNSSTVNTFVTRSFLLLVAVQNKLVHDIELNVVKTEKRRVERSLSYHNDIRESLIRV